MFYIYTKQFANFLNFQKNFSWKILENFLNFSEILI